MVLPYRPLNIPKLDSKLLVARSLLLHPSSGSQSTSEIPSESTKNPPVPLPVHSLPRTRRSNLVLSAPGSEASFQLFWGVRVAVSYLNITASLYVICPDNQFIKIPRIFCGWGMEGEGLTTFASLAAVQLPPLWRHLHAGP